MHPLLKRYFPGLFSLETRRRGRHLQGLSTEQVFTRIYHNHVWLHPESRSGSDSTLEATAALGQALPQLLCELSVTHLLDLPCGDFNWLQQVDLPVECYLGADIVQEVVEDNVKRDANPSRAFVKLELMMDNLPDSDLILCRDCLPHFNYDDIFKAVANLRRDSKLWAVCLVDSGFRSTAALMRQVRRQESRVGDREPQQIPTRTT